MAVDPAHLKVTFSPGLIDGMPNSMTVEIEGKFRIYVQAVMSCPEALRVEAAALLKGSQPKVGETMIDVSEHRFSLAALLTRILASMPEAEGPT